MSAGTVVFWDDINCPVGRAAIAMKPVQVWDSSTKDPASLTLCMTSRIEAKPCMLNGGTPTSTEGEENLDGPERR